MGAALLTLSDGVLDDVDPVTAAANDELIVAAFGFLRLRRGDSETQLLWGRYAYAASCLLYGAGHSLSIEASCLLQHILAEQGLTFDALHLCRLRLAVLSRRGLQDEVWSTRLSLANALHADGQCVQARREISTVRRRSARFVAGRQHAVRVLLSEATILAGCGRTGQAVRLLQARAETLRGLGDFGRHAAARWFAVAEHTHPRVCEDAAAGHTAVNREHDDRTRFWQSQLTGVTSQPAATD
ncbi:hypothetical protein [Paractinoplanes globisporus]|uniref:Uncharacterized protein n=1 Tax=Paractinoplanes globisporus TaxID=113565 RepID=A0ABW6WF07_9ACTN|nr:hypothetical protein [Actinoplanes globisporus]